MNRASGVSMLASLYKGILTFSGALGHSHSGTLRSAAGIVLPGMLLLALACSQSDAEPTRSPSASPTAAAQVQPGVGPGPAPSSESAPEVSASIAPAHLADLAPTPQGEPKIELRTPIGPPPKVDTSIASVRLKDVVFDTFRGGFIRLSDISDLDVDFLRDRIRPIYVPKYDAVEDGDWLGDDDRVIGYASRSGTFAYPMRIMNLHEIVNDVIDGVPVLITYCPLCASGLVNDRRLDGEVLVFGNTSALYQSDMVMYDHQTGSYWFQVASEAIVGPLTGKRMKLLPSMTTTWAQWKQLYPDTLVLSRDLGLVRGINIGDPYDTDPYVGYDKVLNRGRFGFPVSKDRLDDRLRPGDRVFAVQVGGADKAYLLTDRPDQAINDEVGGEAVVIIVRANGPSGSAYLSTFEGQQLSFTMKQGVVVDAQTGSQWDDSGRAVSGPKAGARFTPVPSRAGFWFSIASSEPGIDLYTP